MYKTIRNVHMYAGLFCIPWMLVYATSGLFINHASFFQARQEAARNSPIVYEKEFVPDDSFPEGREARARAILRFLDLDGRHRIQGPVNDRGMTIIRPSAGGVYNIQWRRQADLLVVGRQQFTLYGFVNQLHFLHGYGADYASSDIWAIMVDFVTLSMWVWAISGVYMWLKTTSGRKKRAFGAACLACGALVFGFLAYIFSL